MTATYGIQGHARRGAAPAGVGQAGGAIGSIVYDRTPPDSSYLPANGTTVLASDYPEYAAAINLPPLFGAKLASPAFMPSGSTFWPWQNSGQNAMSDNGEWFVSCEDSETVNGGNYIYRTVNGITTRMFSFGESGNKISSNGYYAVSNNGDVAVAFQYVSTIAIYRNNGDNTWTKLTFPYTGYVFSCPVWTKDSQYLIYGISSSPFIAAIKMPAVGSNVVTSAAITMSATLTASLMRMTRSMAGDRWAMSSGSILNVYDFNQSTMTFTLVTGNPSVQTNALCTSFSQDGLTLLAYAGGTFNGNGPPAFDVWQEPTRGAGFKKLVSMQILPTVNTYGMFLFGGQGDCYVWSSYYASNANYVYLLNGTNAGNTTQAGGSATLVFSGIFPPNTGGMPGFAISRDGLTMISGDSGPTSIQIFRLGAPPAQVPLPIAPSQGYGAAKLFPYVKVRS